MITILSLMLITVSLLSGLIYIIIQIQSNIEQSFSIDYNKKQLELIINSLASKTLKSGDDYILPQGIVSNGYYQLPQWVSNQNDRSINGVPFVYCPVTNSSGTFNETVTTTKGTYNIRVEANLENANIPYIYHSSLNIGDALALLISPIGNNSSMPSCEDVTTIDGNYFAKGGQVSVLTESNIEKYASSFNNDKIVSLSPDTTTPTQAEIDNGDFNTKSLELQMNIFKNNNESELTIYLESGVDNVYNITDVSTFVSNNSSIKKRITIIGDSSNLPTIQHSTDSLVMDLDNTDITLENVLFKGRIESENSNVNIVNSEVEDLKTNNSNLFLDNILASSSSTNALHLINSNLKTNNRIESVGGILLIGSDLKTNPENATNEIVTGNIIDINSSDVLFSNTSINTNGQLIENKGNLKISNAIINTNGQAIENKGNLNIKNSEATLSFKINNYDNSVLNIENSFNNSSSVIVEDMSKMSYVSGSNSNILECVGNIFEDNIIKLELNEGEVVEATTIKGNNAQNWINC